MTDNNIPRIKCKKHMNNTIDMTSYGSRLAHAEEEMLESTPTASNRSR